jgi:flagellar protein FlaH
MKLYSIRLEREEFDKRLGGGIPYSSLVLINGEEGTGKSIICQRLTYSFLKNNISVTYISTQYTTTEFLNQMNSLNYKITHNLIENSLRFVPVYPLIGEVKTREDFAQKLIQAESLFKKDITIIDSFSSLIKYSISEPSAIIELLGFFKKMIGGGKSIILTLNGEDIPAELMEEIELSSTLSIGTEIRKGEEEIKRIMTINKYTGALGDYIEITPFRVVPKVGLIIEISAIV